MIDQDKIKGLIAGAFLGDAISLGPHWIFDTKQIQQQYAPLINFKSPTHTSFHPSKKAGDFTHYGDQAFLLLKHVASKKTFNIESFKKEWLDFVETHSMFMDQATRESVEYLNDGDIGSNSDEIGGFARSGPMFLIQPVDEQLFLDQLRLTHNGDHLVIASVFFIRLLTDVLLGRNIEQALEIHSNIHPFVYDCYEKVLDNCGSVVGSIGTIGQGSLTDEALPAIMAVLNKENNLKKALIENAYAGGDSAARGMILGMIYGARDGYSQLPENWLHALNDFEEIDEALTTFFND